MVLLKPMERLLIMNTFYLLIRFRERQWSYACQGYERGAGRS